MSAAVKSQASVRNSCRSATSLTHPRKGASLYALMPTSRARFAMAKYLHAILTVTPMEPADAISSEPYQGSGHRRNGESTLGRDCVSSEAQHWRWVPHGFYRAAGIVAPAGRGC